MARFLTQSSSGKSHGSASCRPARSRRRVFARGRELRSAFTLSRLALDRGSLQSRFFDRTGNASYSVGEHRREPHVMNYLVIEFGTPSAHSSPLVRREHSELSVTATASPLHRTAALELRFGTSAPQRYRAAMVAETSPTIPNTTESDVTGLGLSRFSEQTKEKWAGAGSNQGRICGARHWGQGL